MTNKDTEKSSLDGELAKRLANQFIFSAVVAFVIYYKVEIYSIITKQEYWKDSLVKMTFWDKGYLLEIIVVIGIYLLAICFGAIISFLREFLSKLFESLLDKIQLTSPKESYNLKKIIQALESDNGKLTVDLRTQESKVQQRTDSFMSQLMFNGQGKVHYSYTTENYLSNPKPNVYRTITNNYLPKNIFEKSETGEIIRFFPEFSLSDNGHLFYEFKRQNLSGICLGHEILFRKMLPGNNHNWDFLFFCEDSKEWASEPKSNEKYLKLVKEKDGSIYLHAKFDK